MFTNSFIIITNIFISVTCIYLFYVPLIVAVYVPGMLPTYRTIPDGLSSPTYIQEDKVFYHNPCTVELTFCRPFRCFLRLRFFLRCPLFTHCTCSWWLDSLSLRCYRCFSYNYIIELLIIIFINLCIPIDNIYFGVYTIYGIPLSSCGRGTLGSIRIAFQWVIFLLFHGTVMVQPCTNSFSEYSLSSTSTSSHTSLPSHFLELLPSNLFGLKEEQAIIPRSLRSYNYEASKLANGYMRVICPVYLRASRGAMRAS